MKKYYIKTFGCAMNQADSEKIDMILTSSGFSKVNTGDEADLIIFNTCSIRQKGEDRVFGLITKYLRDRKKNNKSIVIGITGCMVRKTGVNNKYFEKVIERKRAKKIEYLKDSSGIFNNDDKLFPRLKKLDFTLRIEEIKYLTYILSVIYGENISKDINLEEYLKIEQLRKNPSSVSIIIQTGCDNYCSYCIVPYTRGREQSRDKNEIINEIKKTVKSGAKEINLIGQNVNSYGKQFGDKNKWNKEKSKWNNSSSFKSPFRDLLEEINKIEGIERIRFTSSNPHDMTQDILDAHFDLNKTCNYLHIALQSGNDDILKKMNRKHTYKDFKYIVDYLRNIDPLFSISTDIIVGFSGETDEMFEDTLNAVRECEFDFIYNARYSVRKGTLAAKFFPDDVSEEKKSERWHKLNNLLKEMVLKRNKLMLGKIEKVMINGIKNGEYYGRTRNFKEVYFKSDKHLEIGDLVEVKLVDVDGFVIRGEVI